MKMRLIDETAVLSLTSGILLALALSGGLSHAAERPQLAVFGLEFHDSSHEGELNGPRADETERLALASQEFLRLLEASGQYDIVDLSGEAAAIEAMRPIERCNGCEIDMARRHDADLAVFGIVNKVSNLILDIQIYQRDVETAKVVKYARASIRGNNDKSWMRGLQWLMKNKFLSEEKS